MDNKIISLHVIIKGRVQGVWFRAWTAEKATALGLNGWVRNCANNTVEAVFSGPELNVQKILKLVRNGPILARVDNINTSPTDAPDVAGFEKWPSVLL